MMQKNNITETRPMFDRQSYTPGNNHLGKYEMILPRFVIDDSPSYKLYKEALHEEEKLIEVGSMDEKNVRRLIKLYTKAYKAGSKDACYCILFHNAKLALEHGSIENEDTVLRIFYDYLATDDGIVKYYYAIYKVMALMTEDASSSMNAGLNRLKELADAQSIYAKSFFESITPRDDLTLEEKNIYEEAFASQNYDDEEE